MLSYFRNYCFAIIGLFIIHLLKEISCTLPRSTSVLGPQDPDGHGGLGIYGEGDGGTPRFLAVMPKVFNNFSRGRLKTPRAIYSSRDRASFPRWRTPSPKKIPKSGLNTPSSRTARSVRRLRSYKISSSEYNNSSDSRNLINRYKTSLSSSSEARISLVPAGDIYGGGGVRGRGDSVKSTKFLSTPVGTESNGGAPPRSGCLVEPCGDRRGPAGDFQRHRVVRPQVSHSRSKRSLNSTRQTEGFHIHHVTVGINLGEKDVLLDLRLNRDLLGSQYFEKQLGKDSVFIRRPKPEDAGMCHYQGSIKDVPGSWAALSTCNGIRGVVFDGEDSHYLEPIPGVTKSPTDPHYLFSHQDLLPKNLTCGYYGRPNHPVRELFQDEKYRKLLRYKREAKDGGNIRGPFNANSLSRYVELVLVADKTEYEKHDSDVNKIHERCKDIANIVNALYQPLNIFIALVGVEVWKDEDPIEISTDGDKTLTNFLNYRKVRLIPEHPNDNAQLLTGKVLDSGVVGKALKGPICTYQYSGGVNMDHSDSVGLVATTVAHEMGHNFGMEHDTEEDCKCPDKRCIMAPSSGTKSPSHWSSCSHEYLAISFERSMDYCLRNKPTTLFDSPVCGNGFVEVGEQCDCGLEDHCNNPCCNATNCMLFRNASCATGHCCDLQTCSPKVAGTVCRDALHECDLPEYCSGDSEYCPDNFYKEDGYLCLGGKAYCYNGMCRTHEHQCRLLWGPTGTNSHDQCYNLNLEGNTHGNCGYNWANNTYKKCESYNIKCGMMHCKHFNERLEFGMESVSKVSHRFIPDKTRGTAIPCRVAQVDLGLDMVDPGLAPDGAKCGFNKMCVNQRCLDVSSLRKHVCSCNNRGVCNNMGQCHCDVGFAWPDCKYPGLGGSELSGPASNPNATNQFVVGMFVFFLGVVPFTVIILCLVYFVRSNLKNLWLRKGRPVASRLPGREGSRAASLCVDVPKTTPCDGATGSSTTGAGSPSPPSSQGSKSNSPLLNGHANGAMNAPFSSSLFGRYEGFTLSPIREKAKNGAADATKSLSPFSVEETVTTITPTNTASPSAKGTFKAKPSSVTQNSSASAGSGKLVNISGPSLQTSTNPAVQATSPARSAPSPPLVVNPARAAPQRPISVPDASSLMIHSNIHPSRTLEDGIKEQGKPSAVARIASFLSKKEKGDPSPTSDVSLANQSHTLPRKAAKINRESLLQLEISSPMQLQATDLPNNLVPVRPAPSPPSQNSPLNKVSWGPVVSSPNHESPVSSDLFRIGSVREPSVTARPTIPKFGSMRVPRPKSLPPARPSQPPPRPPLPMIPATPEAEYFYDDCVTVQIAPLASEEDEVSPPQEGIYATIDEDSPTIQESSREEEKKEKKNIFSILRAKTKRKRPTEEEVNEPLYCNISSVSHDERHGNNLKEESPGTLTPVIGDTTDSGIADGGGLLSEIVTELATREPQYVNSLSKNVKGIVPQEDEASENMLPKKDSLASSLALSKSKLNPSSSTSDNTNQCTSYVPYSNVKPRGVFSLFKSSPTSPKNNAEEGNVVSDNPSAESGRNNSLAATMAELKSAPIATKFLSETATSGKPQGKNCESKEGTTSVTEVNISSTNSYVQPTKSKVPSSKTNISRPRPVFPPDKVIDHSTSSNSLPKHSVSSDKKVGGGSNSTKSVEGLKNKGSNPSIINAPIKSKLSSPTSKSKGPVVKPVLVKSAPQKQAVIEKDRKEKETKSLVNNGTNIKKPTTNNLPKTKPVIHSKPLPSQTPALAHTIKKPAESTSTTKKSAETTPSTKKPAEATSSTKKPAEATSSAKKSAELTPTTKQPAELTPTTKKPAESIPTTKKTNRLPSPPSTKRSAPVSSKNELLSSAAKAGSKGSSNVASLQRKFEKESHQSSKAQKPPVKKFPHSKEAQKPK